MATLGQRFDQLINRIRAFLTGPAAVDSGTQNFGISNETYSPEKYGEYIATSNGVYSCLKIRSDLLTSIPLKLYKLRGENKVEVTNGNLYNLLQKVNPFWTFNRLLDMTEKSLGLWGSCYWFVERGNGGRGTPREIWWAKPDRVRVFPDSANYISHFEYDWNGQKIRFEPNETIWLRYPNPINEFAGLSPLAAARLAADMASASMQSNMNIFKNGIQAGGAVLPKAGTELTKDQADTIEETLGRRFKGVDKAHRWAVFRFEAEMKQVGFSPKDAEFLGGLKWALEDICRAYSVPLDLVGGERTYANVENAERAIWIRAINPEARFIAAELTEQLLPMFGEADVAEFDMSEIEALHESETAKWGREQGQLTTGAITINEWREDHGLKKVAWGDVWWAQASLTPVSTDEPPEPKPVPEPLTNEQPLDDEKTPAGEAPSPRWHRVRAVEFGSAEHDVLWRRFARRTERHEETLGKTVAELFSRQKDSILARLYQRAARTGGDAADEPFDMAQWIKTFRSDVRPVIRNIVKDAGAEALDDLGLAIIFDVTEPAVANFLEKRAQRFAKEVNKTTWDQLKKSLSEGMDAGEGIPELANRVEGIMADRIASSKETIARTETIGAYNGGTLEAWKQSGEVDGKEWLSELSDRTRDSHRDAHGQVVGIDDDFIVGSGHGPAPGQIGLAEEDINCRCSMKAHLKE